MLGVEGDWQWSNLTGSNQTLAPLGATGVLPSGPFTVSTTTKDYGSIRGRLGVAFDRFLVFGTGGWATGNPSTAFALTGAVPFVTTGGKSNGWAAGGGSSTQSPTRFSGGSSIDIPIFRLRAS